MNELNEALSEHIQNLFNGFSEYREIIAAVIIIFLFMVIIIFGSKRIIKRKRKKGKQHI